LMTDVFGNYVIQKVHIVFIWNSNCWYLLYNSMFYVWFVNIALLFLNAQFLDHGIESQILELVSRLTGHVLPLSLQMYGCRVIQKVLFYAFAVIHTSCAHTLACLFSARAFEIFTWHPISAWSIHTFYVNIVVGDAYFAEHYPVPRPFDLSLWCGLV
jgi:hypothetical protein